MLTCKDLESMTAWSNHLRGAATLLQTRGADIPNCALGRKGLKLNLQFRFQLVRESCLASLVGI
jgi:hypothetical protein